MPSQVSSPQGNHRPAPTSPPAGDGSGDAVVGAPPEAAPPTEDAAPKAIKAIPYGADEFSRGRSPDEPGEAPDRPRRGGRPVKRLLFRSGIRSYALLGALGNMGRAVRGIVSGVSEAFQRTREHAETLNESLRHLFRLGDTSSGASEPEAAPPPESTSPDELFARRR